jgi:predicted RNA-binding Zn ribbon-like protein
MPASRRSNPTIVVPGVRDDLCLAYANTLAWRGSPEPAEQVVDLGALFAWLAESSGLDAKTLGTSADRARRAPAAATALFAEAIALREAIYRTFSAVAAAAPVPDADLFALNRALADAPARRRLVRVGSDYGWRVDDVDLSVPALLAPVLWSAGDLLVHRDRRRIRQCANEKCLWLFFDASKSATRRWCDMASCGNRAKARRHYLRSKQG